MRRSLTVIIILSLVLAACGDSPTPSPVPAPTATVAAAATSLPAAPTLQALPGIQLPPTLTAAPVVVATTRPAQAEARPVTTSTPASAPVNTISKMRETVSQNDYLITVNGLERAESFNAQGKAKAGFTLVAIDFTVGSNRNKGISANLLYAGLKDNKGSEYSRVYFATKEPLLPTQSDIRTGEKVRGWVTFEVPLNATGLIFVYEPAFESTLIEVALDK